MEPNWRELECIFQELYNKKYLEQSDKILTLIQDLNYNYLDARKICTSVDIRDYSTVILSAYLKRALKKAKIKEQLEEKNNLFELIKLVKNVINTN